MFSNLNFVFKRKCNIVCVIVALLTYGINKLWLIDISAGWIESVCRFYLNDAVCPLFLMGFSNIVFLWAGFEIKSYFKCFLFVMFAGVIWEYFIPLFNTKSTTDPLDLVCYFIGVSVYWLFLKLEIVMQKHQQK